MSTKVFVVEDDDLTRELLCEMVSSSSELALVGQAAAPAEALALVAEAAPDLVLVDLALGDESGIELIASLRKTLPNADLIAHTVFDDRENVFSALKAGAVSYLLKGSPPQALVNALLEVRAGGAPMSPKIARLVIRDLQTSEDALSPRERQILKQIDQGFTYKEIAQDLSLSVHTVHSHIKNIYEGLQASGKRDALAKARSRGLLK